jgi:hypothetical protein
MGSNHSHSQQNPKPPIELENVEAYDLPAMEPVGADLSAHMDDIDWPVMPLPLSPLRMLFAMSELRDESAGNVSPTHDNFYHP